MRGGVQAIPRPIGKDWRITQRGGVDLSVTELLERNMALGKALAEERRKSAAFLSALKQSAQMAETYRNATTYDDVLAATGGLKLHEAIRALLAKLGEV